MGRNDPENAAYYAACRDASCAERGSRRPLIGGWVSTRRGAADYGFVLSLSDFESFHVAPAEAFAAGNAAVFLPWERR